MRNLVFAWLIAFFWTGCGEEEAKYSTQPPPPSGTPGAATPPPSAPPGAPRAPGRRGQPAAAELPNFADESLSIPPFNENARTLPPEAFVEHGKEQRDPFMDFYGTLGSRETEAPSTEPVQMESSLLVLMENYQLGQLSLSGIVWAAGREKALFTDPSGQPVVVMKEDRISRVKAVVREITHDKVLVEVPGQPGEPVKMMEYSLARSSGPYQVQYEKLRADQRGIRVRQYRRNRSRRSDHE